MGLNTAVQLVLCCEMQWVLCNVLSTTPLQNYEGLLIQCDLPGVLAFLSIIATEGVNVANAFLVAICASSESVPVSESKRI